MRATTDHPKVLEALQLVLRALVQHLRDVVCEVEGRTVIDVLCAPIVGRAHDLGLHSARGVGNTHHCLKSLQRLVAQLRRRHIPVDGRAVLRGFGVGGGNEHIERAVAIGREGGVGARRIANIERRIFRHAAFANVSEVLSVLGRGVDGVMRKIDLAIEAEVQHESAAGIALGVDRGVPIAAGSQRFRNEILEGPGRVGVDHDVIESAFGGVNNNAVGALAVEKNPRDRTRRFDARAQKSARLRHCGRERVAAADGMPHAILVLDERQNREEARALERTHAQILRLKAHRESRLIALEVAREVGMDRLPGTQDGRGLEGVEIHEISEASDRATQDGLHERELSAVVGDEAMEGGAIAGLNAIELRGHFLQVASRVDPRGRAAVFVADQEAVHGVETLHLDEIAGGHADGAEDLLEHIGHHEEGRTAVEGEGAGLEAAGAATDDGLRLKNRDIEARGRKQHRGGQSSRTGADDGDGWAVIERSLSAGG